MIPYWFYPTYTILGITFQTWGTFVAAGILVGTHLAARRAKRSGFSSQEIWDIAFWMLLAAFIGARLGHVFFYDWEYFREHLADIVKFWHGGFSSFGGFAGAVIVGIVFVRMKRYDLYRFGDVAVSGLPLGWAIGRIGCFLIHDHPGTLTHFLLGVRYPDGIRHDLGLYDLINTAALALMLFVFRKPLGRHPGASLALVAIWYGVVRFLIDFLRAYDVRYRGLTPAQYGSLLLLVIGVYLFARVVPQRRI